ncbi:MAG TPA: hypothetical protein VMG11_04810 [Steroidobacteraceae bacterium]|nr:hypothetical protein [Steroidobacteraceae bacterium]
MTEHTTQSGTAVTEELRNVVSEAEAFLGALSEADDAELERLRDRVHDSIDAAKMRLADIESDAARQGTRVSSAIESWVADNPWTAVAIGAGVGLALGVLLARAARSARPRGAGD